MSNVPAETERFLHEQIPLTRAMGVRVVIYDEVQFIIEAPLALNHNHLGTAFGGSLNALATLAGYGLLWLELKDQNSHIVIRESSISFLRPVRKDLRAICRKPAQALLSEFKRDFSRKGKARIDLKVTLEEEGLVAVQFAGTFVALK